ncbi:Kelch repeat-containing protein [Enhygromyxa salina]|uniref:Kelch repeat-containing protein n=1 Tax=Enhygromyxa salina TaxID=215803 RepID=UPI0015E73F82|nr:hypothetical protein [Enhygromyxa salina]
MGAPRGREDHTAIWTGSEMIVWGGEVRGSGVIEPLNTGARYSPATDTWSVMTQVGAPDPRDDHAVVWTGTQMIVWGGNQADETTELLASGGRYNPTTDSWTPTASGPLSPRDDATAVWTGTEMIIWGGRTLYRQHEGSGARYNPTTDTWNGVSMVGAPQAREDHSAVWTGTQMIVWGGWSGADDHRQHFRDGARYDPSADSWRPMSAHGAPEPREDHTVVWTGTQMLVWGGAVHEYTPGKMRSEKAVEEAVGEAVETVHADDAARSKAESAGLASDDGPKDKLVQLSSGALYNPATDTWRRMSSTGAPARREDHVALWTGTELIVWGGRKGKKQLADGAIYDPETDEWRPMAASGPEPSARWNHAAVFAEDQMIIWGGFGQDYEVGGARYTP